jgi:predicted nucleic acid-binding protein
MPDVVYWDSCVFLSYVNGDPDRLPDIEGLLEQANQGQIEIITSTVSMVEVAFGNVEQTGKALDPDIEARIQALWTPPSPIRMVEFYAQIAVGAVQLMRDGLVQGWALKPLDAIHLSTAQRWEVKELHTYDTGLHRYAPAVGYSIGFPSASQPKLI